MSPGHAKGWTREVSNASIPVIGTLVIVQGGVVDNTVQIPPLVGMLRPGRTSVVDWERNMDFDFRSILDFSDLAIGSALTVGGVATFLWERYRKNQKIEELRAVHRGEIRELESQRVNGLESVKAAYETKLKQQRDEYNRYRSGVLKYSFKDHFVLLDGAPAAGKSAMLAKWVDPTLDIEKTKLAKTADIAEMGLFLCSEPVDKAVGRFEFRHRLKIVDVPGEMPEDLFDIVEQKPVGFVVLVVDPTRLEESFDRLKIPHLKLLYANRKVLGTSKGLCVYISKSDLAPAAAIASAVERANTEIVNPLKKFYPAARVHVGSAKTGDGILNLHSEVVESLGLSRFYAKHQSLVGPEN